MSIFKIIAFIARAVFTLFFFAIVSIVLYFFAITYLDTPTVYKSHSTKQCVKVVSKDPVHSCRNLPETYEISWIQ